MEGMIKYLERNIEGCDALGGMEREKAVYQSVLKETRKQSSTLQAELEKAREFLKKVIECRGLIYSAPFLEEDIDTFLNEGKK